MPLVLQIIRAKEFIRVGPHGLLDLKASKAVLAQLAGGCRQRGIQRALLDLRQVQVGPSSLLTSVELVKLVETFHEIGFSQEDQLAVLYATDPHCGIGAFAFISNIQGWNVRAFDNYEEALGWLALVMEVTQEEAG